MNGVTTIRRSSAVTKTVLYFTAMIGLGLSSASFGPTLPGLAENTRSPLNQISFLFTARGLGYLLGSFRGGRLYDRAIPGHLLMAASMGGMALCLALVPLISWLWALTGALFFLGLCEGCLDVGANSLLVRVHRERVDPFMNGLHFFFGVGSFISPILIAQALLAGGDIRWAYWGLAILLLPVIAWLASSPSPAALEPAHAAEAAGPTRYALMLGLLTAFFALFVGAESSYGGWIYTYATSLGLASSTAAAYLTSAYWGSFTLARLAGIPIAARFSPKPILIADLCACIAGLALVALGSSSLTVVWLGTLLMGFGMASMFPVGLSLTQRWIPLTGRTTGTLMLGGSIGGMFIPLFIGQGFARLGPQTLPVLLISALVLALAILMGVSQLAGRIKKAEEG